MTNVLFSRRNICPKYYPIHCGSMRFILHTDSKLVKIDILIVTTFVKIIHFVVENEQMEGYNQLNTMKLEKLFLNKIFSPCLSLQFINK